MESGEIKIFLSACPSQ